jgi:hypothetical protein
MLIVGCHNNGIKANFSKPMGATNQFANHTVGLELLQVHYKG